MEVVSEEKEKTFKKNNENWIRKKKGKEPFKKIKNKWYYLFIVNIDS